MTDEIVMQAIAALKTGNKPKAREYLIAAIKQDLNNELAWSWLFTLVDTDEERIHCLKEVLRINPSNAKAQQALDKLEAKYSQPPSFEDFEPEGNKPVAPYIGPTVKVSNPPRPNQDHPVNPAHVPVQNIQVNPTPVSVQVVPFIKSKWCCVWIAVCLLIMALIIAVVAYFVLRSGNHNKTETPQPKAVDFCEELDCSQVKIRSTEKCNLSPNQSAYGIEAMYILQVDLVTPSGGKGRSESMIATKYPNGWLFSEDYWNPSLTCANYLP
jgi:hypothetical protein